MAHQWLLISLFNISKFMFFILDFTQIFWTDLSNITFNFLIYYLLATGKVGVLFLNQQVDILVVIYIMT